MYQLCWHNRKPFEAACFDRISVKILLFQIITAENTLQIIQRKYPAGRALIFDWFLNSSKIVVTETKN